MQNSALVVAGAAGYEQEGRGGSGRTVPNTGSQGQVCGAAPLE